MNTAPLQSAAAIEGAPDPELVRIRDLVYQVAGIFHPDNKLRLLLDRCGRRMKELKANTLQEYLECLTVKPVRQKELIALLNEITIGETCFFRNQPQLDALRQLVVPKIIEAKALLPVRRLRVWSAGCSTGEEPYTLSMLLMEEADHCLKDWVLEIVATDLNEHSLAHAKMAFSRANLSDNDPTAFTKGLDIIFCCNVLIYFDLASKRRVIQSFYRDLLPHGYLFLGHSESLYGVSDDFRLVHFPGTTAYVKGEHAQVGRQ